jgi:hypothetical protein
LKQAYRKEVKKKMGLGINYINKDEFLTIYSSVRTEALNEKNIQSGFRATGLALYDPEQVLSRLNTQMKTLTPLEPLTVLKPPGPQPRHIIYDKLSFRLRRLRNILSAVRRVLLVQANAP